MQKSVVFLYTSNEQPEKGNENNSIYSSIRKNEILNKFDQGYIRLLHIAVILLYVCYKTLLKEIENHNMNKWKTSHVHELEALILLNDKSPQEICRIRAIFIKISIAFFFWTEKIHPEIHMEYQRILNSQNNLGKRKIGRLSLPHTNYIKISYKATVIKAILRPLIRTEIRNNGIE